MIIRYECNVSTASAVSCVAQALSKPLKLPLLQYVLVKTTDREDYGTGLCKSFSVEGFFVSKMEFHAIVGVQSAYIPLASRAIRRASITIVVQDRLLPSIPDVG
jgi:hypothetical protein